MSAFAANVTGTLSADGLTLTLDDISNYTANDENYTTANFTRSLILTDAASAPIETLPLDGADLTADHILTVDLWIVVQLLLVGTGDEGVFSKTVEIPCDRITKNLYRIILQQGSCSNNIIDKRLEFGLQYITGSEIEALAGNGPGFNTDIAVANAYLNAPKF